jgi:TolB-like protein/class 3 adenylate cyclase/cytochrome c-type biogenesis protein CcmH/NrfG
MATEVNKEIGLEIGHVLFIDIVGYSKLLITEQSEQMQKLREIVRGTEQFRLAEAAGKLLRLPTGDGGALVFRTSPEAPVLCAVEISKALKTHPELQVRMGIHSGPVNEITDLNEQANIAGAGINVAQRVMDCGDAGHILLSRHVAEDLEQHPRWRSHLHELGECEVKHGVRMSVVNLYTDEVGNSDAPEKFQKAKEMQAAPAIPEKSIAVLPFENLSSDKENAYFADGIQQEILTQLAKIADLKVISRTSTQRYQSKPGNLSEIAKQLGVANVLEGSVQKAADQVRVNVQLINAQTDSHLWAETYDRKLTDIFGVESEIAKGIAESLQAELAGHEEQALAVKPTNNPEAYDAYLRGLAFAARGMHSAAALREAIDSYDRAVQFDPNFALAWARLSRAHAEFWSLRDRTAARRDAAKKALENAQKLQPNSPETLLALGYYQYWVLSDYGPAKTTLGRVRKMLPGNSDAPWALGLVTRREGRLDESVAYFEQALALDPRNTELLADAAETYAIRRQYPAALKLYDRALDITPNDPGLLAAKAAVYHAEGNLQEAAKLLREVSAHTDSEIAYRIKVTQLRLERNYGAAIHLLQTRLAQFRFGSEIDKGISQIFLAWVQRLADDIAGARVTAKDMCNTFEPCLKKQPDNLLLPLLLSHAYAVLSEKGPALKAVERAVELLPSAKDQRTGIALEEHRAIIDTILGENSRAISTLTQLLQTLYLSSLYMTPITPALLRLDPIWDPLRGDPRFEKLANQIIPPDSR